MQNINPGPFYLTAADLLTEEPFKLNLAFGFARVARQIALHPAQHAAIKTKPAKRSVVGHQNASNLPNRQFRAVLKGLSSIRVMVTFLFGMLAYARAFLMKRHTLAVEAAALRQQLAVYKRKQLRPKLNQFDRLFWVAFAVFGTSGPKLSFSSSPTP